MKRIIILLLMALTIHSTTVAQPSKGKKKTTATKAPTPGTSNATQDMEGAVHIAVAKVMSAIEKEMEKAKLLSDSSTLDTSEQSPSKPYQTHGWVNDFTHLFTPAQQTELDSLITAFEKATTVEIAIVTIDSSVTSRNGFDDYITALGNRWGVGKKETNNGVVIGICPGYKRIRISTGTGIGQQLTDQETKAIINNIILPQYRLGDYFSGTQLGLLAVMQELKPAH